MIFEKNNAESTPTGSPSPFTQVRQPRGNAVRREKTRLNEAQRRAFGQLSSVVLIVIAISVYVQFTFQRAKPSAPESKTTADATAPAVGNEASIATNEVESPVTDVPKSAPPPAPPAAPEFDKAAVTAAEEVLDATSRDRARADERVATSARQLTNASAQAALDAARARKLAFIVRDPSTRITQAAARGGFLRSERDKIEKEVSALRQLPRPKSTSILSKSPVARPAASTETHFELRHNRVSFIDLEKLLEMTKADAQLRIRMSDLAPAISNKIGPVGSFSLEYELVKSVPNSMEELIERRIMRRYDLRAWEIVPEIEGRGETYEATQNPISEFSRTINRISPNRATITLWVYPDSFALYRNLRNDLVARGFSVAARPLPDGMTIRGSPMGTQSAAQ